MVETRHPSASARQFVEIIAVKQLHMNTELDR